MWLIAALLLSEPAAFHVPVAPAESIWVDVRGAGRTVVLIPGLTGSVFGYRQLLRGLADHGWRTVVVEPLGVGRSSRPPKADYSLTAQATRLAAVLDTLQESRVLLVAHSLGASIALRLAVARPDLVRGLVLLDGGAAESAATPRLRDALRLAPLLRLPGGRARMRKEMANELVRASGSRQWITEDVIDGYVQFVTADIAASILAFQQMANAREPASLHDRLALIRSPVRLLVGGSPARSAGLRDADVARLRQQIRDIQVETLPGVGHYIHEEQPAAVICSIHRVDVEAELPAPSVDSSIGRRRVAPCAQS